MGCVEGIIRFFNYYAFVQVAIYGKSFIEASHDTWQLFKARGTDLLVNDDLSGSVFFLGSFLGGAISALIASIWALSKDVVEWDDWAFLAFVLGFLVSEVAMSVVSSGVATTFVCYAEDPFGLQQNRVEHYDIIRRAETSMRNKDYR